MPSILLEYKHAPVHERQHETSDRDVLWQGHCPNAALDGVAEATVETTACADRMTGQRCQLSIASAIFSCGTDFCNSVFPPVRTMKV